MVPLFVQTSDCRSLKTTTHGYLHYQLTLSSLCGHNFWSTDLQVQLSASPPASPATLHLPCKQLYECMLTTQCLPFTSSHDYCSSLMLSCDDKGPLIVVWLAIGKVAPGSAQCHRSCLRFTTGLGDYSQLLNPKYGNLVSVNCGKGWIVRSGLTCCQLLSIFPCANN